MPSGDGAEGLRLLTVTHFYESHGGGIERVAGQLCRRLSDAGSQAAWAASAADGRPQDERIIALPLTCADPLERVTGLPMPVPSPEAMAKLFAEVRASDGVIIHDALYVTSIAAAIAARRARKPIVLIQHIAEIPFSNPVMRAIMKLANALVARPMLSRADQVVFISATTRDHFARVKLKRPPVLLFNGVDHSIFSDAAGCAPRETRARNGLPEEGRLVLFVGRFVEKKGLNILRSLARRRPDLTFALAGQGPIDPGSWSLPNVVTLSGLSGESLAGLYRAADVFLLPSVGEGYPLVVQEAMACGAPIICGADTARADPAASRFLEGVEISLSDPEGTAARLSRAIDLLATGRNDRAEMTAYARRAYDWRLMAARIASLFDELLDDGATAQEISHPARLAAS